MELTPLTEEIEAISGPALLRDVHFFAGLARSPEHLLACGVAHAKVAMALVSSTIVYLHIL